MEMNMVDPGYYSLLSQQLKTDQLSAVCKKELLEGPSHEAALHKHMDRQLLPLQWIINRPTFCQNEIDFLFPVILIL